jgi:outer membrane biosynthesis protein TonB
MDAEKIVSDVAERVRELVSEAEQRAGEIVRGAEEDARRIRAEAEEQAKERLDQVRAAIDELQSRFVPGARPGHTQPTESEVQPGPVTVPEPTPPATPEPTPDPVPEPSPPPGEPIPAPEPVPEPSPPPDEADPPEAVIAGGNGGDDTAAARLIAMKLALDGASKDEARAELSAEYAVPDLDGLLDDVYAKAGK